VDYFKQFARDSQFVVFVAFIATFFKLYRTIPLPLFPLPFSSPFPLSLSALMQTVFSTLVFQQEEVVLSKIVLSNFGPKQANGWIGAFLF
jgi:hypothetical protein